MTSARCSDPTVMNREELKKNVVFAFLPKLAPILWTGKSPLGFNGMTPTRFSGQWIRT